MPNILSIENTLKIAHRKSICRFGDGEITLMYRSEGIRFQKYSDLLSERLLEVYLSNDPDICICIPDIYSSLSKYDKRSRTFWFKIIKRYRLIATKDLDKNKDFGTSFISRPYMMVKDKSRCFKWFSLMKQLWDNKDIIIVEGEFSRLGVGNKLFDNAKSIERVLTKCENAFDVYDEILAFCSMLPKKKLIVLAIGPTATVLSFDLTKLGYHSLDLGHIDIEYEWFLKKAKVPVIVKNKSNNETGSNYAISSEDKKYLSEIIQQIGV